MISERNTFIFAGFVFDANEKLLRRASGEYVSMPPKTCELLAFFIENAGRLISKDELLEKVWAETFVEESNLTHHIAVLRKALEESAGSKFIETVPRKGYRFVVPVVPQDKFEIVVTERGQTRIVEEEIDSPENPLIGREREISTIKNLLRRKDTKILTLTAVGGAGKTSLAKAVFSEISGEFAGGAFFIDLSAINDSALVVATIAQNLKIQASSEGNLVELLKNNLREKEFLLVLDNFEQILDAAPEIAQIAAGSSKILVTSRARLHLSVEREFQLLPLQIPVKENLPEELIECAAVRLFVERARRAKPNFELTDENAAAVGEICRRLEGLPLAIELAATRLSLLSPAAILKRLNNQLSLLTGGANDLPNRQKTIRGAIAWSYDLLEVEDKSALETLTVFHGDFSLEAAESVIESLQRGGKSRLSLDSIGLLVNQNLVQKVETATDEPRFRLLEAIREFATEKLAEGGKSEPAKKAHAEYFLEFTERIEAERRGSSQKNWFQDLRAENDNVRAAMTYLLETDAEKAMLMAVNVHIFWSVNYQFGEGRRWFAAILEKAPDVPTEIRAVACKGAALLAWKQGDYDAARDLYKDCLKIGETLQNDRLIAIAKNGLGIVCYMQNDNPAAKVLLEDALILSRGSGENLLTNSILTSLGEIARLDEDYAAARLYNAEVADFARLRGDKNYLTGCLLNAGSSAFLDGDFVSARKLYAEVAALAEELKLNVHLSLCFDGFAALYADTDWKRSAILAGAAEHLREKIGYRLELPDRVFREKYYKRLMETGDVKNLETAIAAGRSYTTEEAIDAALGR